MSNLSLKTGFTPVQTRVTLANNATTVVQNFSAYDAQELTGFVYIDATTDYRAAVKVTIFKNGAGTYEIAISDVAGDLLSGAPIVSFSISSVGVLSATLVSFAGYVTAYIQFNLNAPALGGQFPLQVDGANVSLATASVQGAYKAGQAVGQNTGASIGTGNLGEVVFFNQTTLTNFPGTTTQFANVLTLSSGNLSNGVWLLHGVVSVTASGATGFTAPFISVSDFSGNTTTDHSYPTQTQTSTVIDATATPSHHGYINGAIVYMTGSNSKYIKIRCDFATGTPQYRYGIRAVRIA